MHPVDDNGIFRCMGVGDGVKLVGVAACLALLPACADEQPVPTLAWLVGGTAGTASSVSASGGGGAGSAGAPSGCASDPLPVAVPSALDGDMTTPVLSDGCGKAYACAPGKRSLQTKGWKPPDCVDVLNTIPKCGPWSAERDFYVNLPQDYDPQKPYALVIQTPQCGGTGLDVDSLSRGAGAYFAPDYSLIRVGISPGPNSTGHPADMLPDVKCFDDEEGDDSIDWVFYENLYDKLNAELCFDRRHVFVNGRGDGGRIANELGCRYAGTAIRPVRGVFIVEGDLPPEASLPTCSQAPLAGLWVHQVSSPYGFSFDSVKRAITRAMPLDQCPGGDYDHAQFENFPIAGGKCR